MYFYAQLSVLKTGAFDASEYADDEYTQFLNAAFVDDPTGNDAVILGVRAQMTF